MATLKINHFGGIAPKVNHRYLPENRAVTATNVDATRRGSLRPLYGPDSGVGKLFNFIGTGNVKTLFRYKEDYLEDDGNYWLASNNNVSFCRGQITGDTNEVVYFTNDDNPNLGPRFFYEQNVPASTTGHAPLGNVSGITNSYELGVPAPQIAPSLSYTTPQDVDGLAREFRKYVFTYVWKFAGREMESAPSPPSSSQEYYFEGGSNITVNFLGQNSVPRPHMATDNVYMRVYRAVSGGFFFVSEVPVHQPSFTDAVPPDSLGEALPSLTWSTPPKDLRGITNMANGIIAGFTGRDVYFCEPYIPHAWPVQYAVTVDSPVVSLVSLDTTLVVLTRERPYFIQGSNPEVMTVVKADIAQGCIAPRSAVAINGEVYFVSPDGLVATSPRGSRIVTEELFSYKQWNDTISPNSIHAYSHDLKYFGFVEREQQFQSSFVYDIPSQQFVVTSEKPTAAFVDLRLDKMYVVYPDSGNPVKRWGEGSPLVYEWRSRMNTMLSEVSFSMIQVEAESYGSMGHPLVCDVYADGSLLHTINVTGRDLYRIPAKLARDWQVRITGRDEIFNVALAQEGRELAGV